MSYEPTIWTTGDTLTASAMNKIEDGIANAGGGLPEVTAEDDGSVLTVVEGEWAKGEAPSAGGGYDLVFMTTTMTLSNITTSNVTLESGTFADAYAKASAGEKLSIRFYGYDYVSSEEWYFCDYDVSGVYADLSYHDGIEFYVSGGYAEGGTIYNYAYAASSSGGSVTSKRYGVMSLSPIRVVLTESGIAINRVDD